MRALSIRQKSRLRQALEGSATRTAKAPTRQDATTRWHLGVLAVYLWSGGAGTGATAAAAPPEPSALSWTRLPGAEACIGPRDLAQAVERRLGRAVFVSAAQAELFVDGHVEPSLGGFRARVDVSNARGVVLGTRDLEDPEPSCRALDEQLELVIALLVDPDSALRERARPSPPAAAAAPQPPQPPTTKPPAREPSRASLSLGPAFLVGLLPKLGAAASLRGEIVPSGFVPIEIGGAVWLGQQADGPMTDAQGATIFLSYATLGACPLVYRARATSVRGCADVLVGAIRTEGFGFTGTNTGQESPLVGAIARGWVNQRVVGPLEVGVGLGIAVPFMRPRFVYLDAARSQQELFRVGAVAGLLDVGVGLAFP